MTARRRVPAWVLAWVILPSALVLAAAYAGRYLPGHQVRACQPPACQVAVPTTMPRSTP